MKKNPKTKIIARIEGRAPPVLVTERGDYRALCFAHDTGLVQGSMHRHRHLSFRTEYFQQQVAAALFHPRPRTALFLGLGIGAVARLCKAIWPDLHIDVVEICDTVVNAATTYFGLQATPTFRIHVVDATDVIQRPPLHGVYDLVFSDCYNAASIAPECLNSEFLANCIRCLSPTGILVTNILPNRSGAGRMAKNLGKHVAHPWLLSAQKRNNQTLFGHASNALANADALERARKIDADKLLPFELVPEVMRAITGPTVHQILETW